MTSFEKMLELTERDGRKATVEDVVAIEIFLATARELGKQAGKLAACSNESKYDDKMSGIQDAMQSMVADQGYEAVTDPSELGFPQGCFWPWDRDQDYWLVIGGETFEIAERPNDTGDMVKKRLFKKKVGRSG